MEIPKPTNLKEWLHFPAPFHNPLTILALSLLPVNAPAAPPAATLNYLTLPKAATESVSGDGLLGRQWTGYRRGRQRLGKGEAEGY